MKCKITVLKKLYNPDIVKQYSNFGEDHGPCTAFSEGQTFISGIDMPEGFCGWAWDDIHKIVLAALSGANFNTLVENCTKDDKGCIACCTDGYRPVVFYIEAISEE